MFYSKKHDFEIVNKYDYEICINSVELHCSYDHEILSKLISVSNFFSFVIVLLIESFVESVGLMSKPLGKIFIFIS